MGRLCSRTKSHRSKNPSVLAVKKRDSLEGLQAPQLSRVGEGARERMESDLRSSDQILFVSPPTVRKYFG